MEQEQQQTQKNRPGWLRGDSQINEVKFCQQFRLTHDVIYQGGSFFSTEGRVTNEQSLRQDIYKEISAYITTNVQQRVDKLMAALKLDCGSIELKENDATIHVKNGTCKLGEKFSPYKHYCRNRLNANFDPSKPCPQLWLDFLDELLEKEDILTLQEYMGYCLLPTTVAQKMLIIIGNGGEGKSRIGIVMKALLGNACAIGSLAKVETNRFARADLEHLLVMVDDDLKMDALPDTNYIKSIVTAETPVDLERKGQQSYQGKLNVRFIAFGNGTLQALHDRSYGFFRRQIILTTKPLRPDREDDPFLGQRLSKEIDGILNWCLEGLYRLIENNFQFTISERTRQNLHNSMIQGNNILEFLQSSGYFTYDSNASVSSRKLYHIYKDWCEDNNLAPMTARTFWSFLSQNEHSYRIRHDKHVYIGEGREVRGFRGIRAHSRYL